MASANLLRIPFNKLADAINVVPTLFYYDTRIKSIITL